MKYIADLHIHSHFSRATSKASNLHGLACWAAAKGIQVVGTGDFTHPGWYAELSEHLEEAEPGFFRLKAHIEEVGRASLPPGVSVDTSTVRFVLTAEVSSIYKRAGKVRKIHNILFAPNLETVARVNGALAAIGNIESDGRPILGLDARDLLEIMLEKAPEGFLVPAHIWTPWFSLFGSKSGFDDLEECFADLSSHIFALETGLSSDPEMNRLISALDGYTLISNSDCHSPSKLGREANLFDTEFNYYNLREAMRSPVDGSGKQVFEATVEFYPEEGKYHCDGHRKCGVCFEPYETTKHNSLCPVCGKPLTVGVLHRVMELADRQQPSLPEGAPAVHSLIPLNEVLSELLGTGPNTKKVNQAYSHLLQTFGTEFNVLLHVPIEEISAKASSLLGEAIHRMRQNRVIRQPGYDGEFGVIKVFSEGELSTLRGQLNLFGITPKKVTSSKRKIKVKQSEENKGRREDTPSAKQLNKEQQDAVISKSPHQVVHAGPGTGKTHTLVNRVVHVIRQNAPFCTVITFTNKAADEVASRLRSELGVKQRFMVATFHGYCLYWLREKTGGLDVAGPDKRLLLLRQLFPEANSSLLCKYSEQVSAFLHWPPAAPVGEEVRTYLQFLDSKGLIDLEAILPCGLGILKKNNAFSKLMRSQTGHLFVDEFQDVSPHQFELVRLLAETSPVFAIGDPDQSIYGFRGSDPGLFSTLQTTLDAEVHTLITNYRSGYKILKAAESLIGKNHINPPIPMKAKSNISGRLHLQCCDSPIKEARFVVHQLESAVGGTSHRSIEKLQEDGNGQVSPVSLADICILYRTSRQAQVVASELTGKGIPFQLVDVEAFYTKEPCRLLYYWLLLLGNCAEIDEQLYLFSRQQGVGKKSMQVLTDFLLVLQSDRQKDALLLEQPSVIFKNVSTAKKLAAFQDLYLSISDTVKNQGLSAAFDSLLKHYSLDSSLPEILRFRQMVNSMSTSVEELALYFKRFSDSVIYDNTTEAVTLSTLHASKGLEFKVVFIIGLEDGLLPLAPREPIDDQKLQALIEEERRLFYVGMTRAIETLYMTWCAKRSDIVHNDQEKRTQSPFLQEIPQSLLSELPRQDQKSRAGKSTRQQLRLFG